MASPSQRAINGKSPEGIVELVANRKGNALGDKLLDVSWCRIR